jgi:hypothetical protein
VPVWSREKAVTQRVTSRRLPHGASLLCSRHLLALEVNAPAARSGSGHSLLHALNSHIRRWLPRRSSICPNTDFLRRLSRWILPDAMNPNCL